MRIFLAGILISVLLFLGLLGFGSWLLYTPSGSEWLLTRILIAPGDRIDEIEGTLIGQLQLRGVAVGRPAGRLNCEKVLLVSRLRQLFPLQLEIEQLQLEKLIIDKPATEPSGNEVILGWPERPWWFGMVEIDLQQLELLDFRLQEQQQTRLDLEQLQGRVTWREQRLQLSNLKLQLPEYEVSGALSGDFINQAIESDLLVQQRNLDSTWQKLQLQAQLQTTEKQLLAGPVSLSLNDNRGPILEASAELGLDAAALQFRQLRLQRPGRSGLLLASGRLSFVPQVGLDSRLQLSELDLQAETGQMIRLSGELTLTGSADNYQGRFSLVNRAENPLAIQVSGSFTGDQEKLRLTDLQGSFLEGVLAGEIKVSWAQGWQMEAELSGQKLDPRLLNNQLTGEVNLDMKAALSGKENGIDGRIQLLLNNSTLHNQPLTGTADLTLRNRQLEIEQLELFGEGLSLQGSGSLDKRIKFSWQIERLEQLFAGYQGQISGSGWLSLQSEGISAAFSAQAEQLVIQQWQLAQGRLQGNTLEDQDHWQLAFSGEKLTGAQPQLNIETIGLEALGSLDRHRVKLELGQTDASLEAIVRGGWREQRWQGELSHLVGEDQQFGRWQTRQAVPLALSAERLQLEPLELNSDGHGLLRLQGYFLPPDRTADLRLEWQQLDLGLFRHWLVGWQIEASSSGSLLLQMNEEQSLHADLSLLGRVENDNLSFNLRQADLQADWNRLGLESLLKLNLADGSQLEAELTSPVQASFNWPEQGQVVLSGQNIPLARLQPWLPPAVNLAGKLGLKTSGQWQTDKPWVVSGKASVTEGRLFSQGQEDLLSADFNVARLDWTWQDNFSGDLQLQLQDHGNIEARFNLPLAAQWPLLVQKAQPLTAELSAELREKGLLSLLFPGRVQESRGQLQLDLQLEGSWDKPSLQGEVQLSAAGAFLPTLGIQLQEVELLSVLSGNQVEIKNLRLVSGEGDLSGQGQVTLQNWRPQSYQLQIKGERFQLVNLPELQVRVTPDLKLDGGLTAYRVRGDLTIPELLAKSGKKTTLVENSPDLQIMDAESPVERRSKLVHDVDLELLLGDRVLLDSAGIDARLEGRLRLQSTARQELAANGEINVAKGKYASYGVNLDITRGNLLFTGGPLDQPTLDILALRTAGEVQAGVKVTGTPKQPVVELYSEPAMAETDILSYIVLGRPVGTDGSQSGLLMTAAGALLSQGESVVLQEKLKSRLGLDVLDISAGDGNINSSVITTGKYLNPDLYVSLGYSLFGNSNEVKVRYSLNPDWELESNIGTESGVDLYYKIDIE